MRSIHRSRSLAPVLDPLEGRVLLSGTSAKPLMMTATQVIVTDQGVYNKHHVLTSVELMATVKPASGSAVPTGTVTFNMVMPAKSEMGKMTMTKMKSGTTNLGTVTLTKGEAMLTVKPKMVLKMPLQIIYNGDANFMASSTTPPMLTKSALKGMTMGPMSM